MNGNVRKDLINNTVDNHIVSVAISFRCYFFLSIGVNFIQIGKICH